jgi:ergothioneine biosynthesis protein EgtB
MKTTADLRAALVEAREHTLQLFADVDDADFCRQAHPDFSPLGWHFGHIGVTEAYWVLQQCNQEPTLSAAYDRFFTPTDNPKPNRINLPPRAEIEAYLQTVRERVLAFVETVDVSAAHPLLNAGGIFHMLLQHEEQHNETILLIKQLLAANLYPDARQTPRKTVRPQAQADRRPAKEERLAPGGSFLMGSNDVATTLDNERPQHPVSLKPFAIDRFPVTNDEFLQFLEADGYEDQRWWSPEGWQWRAQHAVAHPLYWRRVFSGWGEVEHAGVRSLVRDAPVRCVSWYEAEAYARFVGKRLPTESEWEQAATLGLLEATGQVWEWTATWFAPYPGFVAHPYDGYSTPYFDNCHRVLRGGSWATRPHVKRIAFRNWYHPWVREIFSGMRCARDA